MSKVNFCGYDDPPIIILAPGMNGKPLKTKRIGKHYFRLVGGDNLYYKGELTISFAPLKKKYLSLYAANSSSIDQFSLPSTTTANTSPLPSICLPPPLKTIHNYSRTTHAESRRLLSKSLKLYASPHLAFPQTSKQTEILRGLQRSLLRLQGPHRVVVSFTFPEKVGLPGPHR